VPASPASCGRVCSRRARRDSPIAFGMLIPLTVAGPAGRQPVPDFPRKIPVLPGRRRAGHRGTRSSIAPLLHCSRRKEHHDEAGTTRRSHRAGAGTRLHGRRDEVQFATKAGLDFTTARGKVVIRNDPGYLKAAADASLLRLGTDRIDLYYLHRVSPEVPLEDSIGARY